MAIAEREVLAPRVPPPVITEEEYLAWEELAEEKTEYIEGKTRAMSGGTDYHGALAMNMGAALIVALRGKGCLVMSSDVKVWAGGAYYYPDASVVCGPREYRGNSRTVITNPILVVEVLSPSTEGKDRGEKFLRYQQVETLLSYVLVSQEAPRVEVFLRGENEFWKYEAVTGLEGVLEIPALSVTLALADIYDQIDLTGDAGTEPQ